MWGERERESQKDRERQKDRKRERGIYRKGTAINLPVVGTESAPPVYVVLLIQPSPNLSIFKYFFNVASRTKIFYMARPGRIFNSVHDLYIDTHKKLNDMH